MIEGYRYCKSCKHDSYCKRSLLECKRYQSIDNEKALKRRVGILMYPLVVVCLAICFLAYLLALFALEEFSFLSFVAWLFTTLFLIFFLLPSRKDS